MSVEMGSEEGNAIVILAALCYRYEQFFLLSFISYNCLIFLSIDLFSLLRSF